MVEAENWRQARIIERLEASALLRGGPGLVGALRKAINDGETVKKAHAIIYSMGAAA